MANLINADPTNGLKLISDSSSEIQMQANGVTVATVNSSGLSMTGGKTITGDVIPAKPYAFYTYDASTQTISNATITKLEYDSIAYETGSTSYYNTSTYTWTAPYNGIYLVNHFVEFAGGANDVHSGIYVNGGGDTPKGFRDVWNQSGNSVTSGASNHSQYNVKFANLVAGDTLEFYTYHSSGASKNLTPSRTGVQIALITLL